MAVDAGYEKWQDTVDTPVNNSHLGEYDQTLKAAVGEFNTRLGTTSRYVPLDWKLIKAIILTETSGPELPVWQSNPMQIGNPGDPGLKSLWVCKRVMT